MKKKIFTMTFIIITLFIFGACQGQSSTIESKKYEDFQHIDHWDDINQFTDEETLVFYYSPYCEICQSIQAQATQYLTTLEANGLPIYMVHEGFIYQQGTPPLDHIETPSILIYRNRVFDEKISGSKPILNYLETKTNP